MECSITDLPFTVALEGITQSGAGQISGEARLYSYRTSIGVEGEEIAGSGSFNFNEGVFTIIWTAAPINDGWYFSYQSE